jgi:hypothetical protein
MRPQRKWLALAVPAALATLVAVAAPASAAPAAPQMNGGVVHHAATATDCEYIENYADDYGIAGNGVNTPVTLHTTGQCFTPMFEFTVLTFNTSGQEVYANGWEYQNSTGHCLWNDGGTIETGAACKTGHPNEEFYGIPGSHSEYGGWLVANVTDTPSGTLPGVYMGANGDCEVGSDIIMGVGDSTCNLWNFPSG